MEFRVSFLQATPKGGATCGETKPDPRACRCDTGWEVGMNWAWNLFEIGMWRVRKLYIGHVMTDPSAHISH